VLRKAVKTSSAEADLFFALFFFVDYFFAASFLEVSYQQPETSSPLFSWRDGTSKSLWAKIVAHS